MPRRASNQSAAARPPAEPSGPAAEGRKTAQFYSANGHAGPAAAGPPLDAVSAHELEAQELDWFAVGWATFGSFGLLGGAKGAGKSTVAAARAAGLTGRGLKVPGQVPRKKGNVLWFTAEEDVNTTTKRRLKLCGANLKKVLFPGRRPDGSVQHKLSLPDDLPWLEALIVKHKVRYVVLDVLSSFVNHRKTDLKEEQPSRWLSELLAALAERTGCYIDAIRHCRKGTDGTHVDHFLGSGAIAAVARHVVAVKRLAGPGGQRALILTESNFHPQPAPMLFTLKGPEHVGRPVWLTELDPDDSRLQQPEEDRDDAVMRRSIEGDILEALKDGEWHPSKPLVDQIRKDHGVHSSTVTRRACQLIDEPKPRVVNGVRAWHWRLKPS